MSQNPAKRKCCSFPPENVTCAQTDVQLDDISFLWDVKSYSVLRNDREEVLSPMFRGGPKHDHCWQLIMKPSNRIEGIDYLGLLLKLVDYGDNDNDKSVDRVVKLHYELSILNNQEPAVRTFRCSFFQDFKKGEQWGENQVVSVEDLVSDYRELVVDDSFTVLCEIRIHGERKGSVSVGNFGAFGFGPSKEEMAQIQYESMVNDFGKLFKESIASDCSVDVEQISFKAHKVILMARSSVFAAMFNAPMKEKEGNVAKIIDFDKEVVEGMLQHLYTGQTDCLPERASELLQIAEKYDLQGLKKDCEFIIARSLGKENAVDTLILARTHNAPNLKEKAVDFINRHKDDLLKSKSFVDTVKAHADVGLLTDIFFTQ